MTENAFIKSYELIEFVINQIEDSGVSVYQKSYVNVCMNSVLSVIVTVDVL